MHASLPIVVHAVYRGDFRIRVVFNGDVEAIVDFSDWLSGPVFESLRDPEYFSRFFIDGGTIAWPNGADIAPATLHERAKVRAA